MSLPAMTAGQTPKLWVKDLHVTYRSQSGEDVEAVRGVEFDIADKPGIGEIVVFLGPSGCGKSTILKAVAGLLPPTRGEILSEGKPVDRPGRDRLVVFQESALFPWMVTSENVLYGPKARGEHTPEAEAFAQGILDKVGLRAFRARFPSQLSGGMQRRAELSRTLSAASALSTLRPARESCMALSSITMRPASARRWFWRWGPARSRSTRSMSTADTTMFMAPSIPVGSFC